MYPRNSWRRHVGRVGVEFLNQETDTSVGDPITAYVPGEVTHVSWMTDVHPKFLEKSPVYRGSRLSAPGTRYNRGGHTYSPYSWSGHLGIEDDQCTS